MTKLPDYSKSFKNTLLYHLPISDRLYFQIRFLKQFGRLPDLNDPLNFNEKLIWMNINGLMDKYSSLADKLAVRDYVSEKAGERYLVNLIGAYKNVAEIDFDQLPNQFVLKATHGSHWLISCLDKQQMNVHYAKNEMACWLTKNYYRYYRERCYRNIPPAIICEEMLEFGSPEDRFDYRLLCFNGKAMFINVIYNRLFKSADNIRMGIYYDREWNTCFFKDDPHYPEKTKRPGNLEEMIEVAESLSIGIPFVRVDLYVSKSNVKFGELTFLPNAGLGKFTPAEWERKLGSYIQLPSS